MTGRLLTLVAVVVAVVHLSTAESISAKVVIEESAEIGKRGMLICFLSGNTSSNSSFDGPVSYQWFLNDKRLPGVNSSTLIIPRVKPEDEGNYTCRVLSENKKNVSLESPTAMFTVRVSPVVTISQKTDGDLLVLEGGNLSLTCHLTNNPNPLVEENGYTWWFRSQKDGPPVMLPYKKKDLKIQPVTRNQTGRYECNATNGVNVAVKAHSENASIDVQVQYLDDHMTLNPKEWQTVNIGDNVTWTCQADSVPTAKLTWLHQSHIIRTVESNKDVYSLTATGCDSYGEYQCRAENSLFQKSPLAQTKLIVKGCAPELEENLTSPPKVTGYIGENVTLTVSVTAHPAPSFLWSGPGLSSPVPQSASLTLYNLQPQQAGIYTVNVSNCHGPLIRTFKLDVIERPSAANTKPILGTIGGILVLLVCVAIGCLLVYIKQRRRCKTEIATVNKQDTESTWSQGYPLPGTYDPSFHSGDFVPFGLLPRPCGPSGGSSQDYTCSAPLMPTAPFVEGMLADRSSSEIDDDVTSGLGLPPPPPPPLGHVPLYDVLPPPRSTGH